MVAQCKTRPTAQPAPTPPPATARPPVVRPASVSKLMPTSPTVQPVLRLQTSPETAAHLVVRRASVSLITFPLPTALPVPIALLVTARPPVARPGSVSRLTLTSQTAPRVLLLQTSPETAAHLVARPESVLLITFRSATVLHVV